MARNRFIALDGLRGLGALVVIAMHANTGRFIPAANLAVDFFFCLSGFVLAHAYVGRVTWRQFIGARWLRLYPLYFAGLILGLLVALSAARLSARLGLSAALGFTLVPAGFAEPWPFDPPAWSLFFEIVVGAIWFAVTPWLSKTALLVALALSGAALLVGILSVGSAGDLGAGSALRLALGFPRSGFSFLAGTAVYRLWRRMPSPTGTPLLLLPAILMAPIMAPLPRVVVDPVAIFLVFPALIWLGASAVPKGWSATVCETAGRASYPAYILHAPLILFASTALSRYAPRLPHSDYVLLAIFAPAMFGFSLLADRFYDRPVRSWLGRLSGSRSPRLATT